MSRLLVLGGWSDLTSSPARCSTRPEIRHRDRAFSLSTAEVGSGKTTLADRFCQVLPGTAVVHTASSNQLDQRGDGTRVKERMPAFRCVVSVLVNFV